MRRLKKLFNIITVIVLIIGSCLIGFNVHGYDYQIDYFNYSPYNYLGRLDDIVIDGQQIASLDFTMYATCNSNSVTFLISPYTERIDYNEGDYLATYNELIDSTSFVEGEYYFIYEGGDLYLHNCCLFNVYYNYQIYNYYNNGYALGINSEQFQSISDAFNDGYSKGTKDTQKLVDDAIRQTNLNNQDTINYLNAEIDRLNDLLDDDSPSWANFKNLLSTIFMYPINFFKEGFGVEVWGINIGYFIIGLFMIFVTLSIIAFVKRGSAK